MEYRFVINYEVDRQQESLDVVTDSSNLTQEEAQRRVYEKTKPYAPKEIKNISVRKLEQSDNINTDPETSASE
jgi:hypothetical protein